MKNKIATKKQKIHNKTKREINERGLLVNQLLADYNGWMEMDGWGWIGTNINVDVSHIPC